MKKFLKMGALAACLAVSPAMAEESTVTVQLSDQQHCEYSLWICEDTAVRPGMPMPLSGNSFVAQPGKTYRLLIQTYCPVDSPDGPDDLEKAIRVLRNLTGAGGK